MPSLPDVERARTARCRTPAIAAAAWLLNENATDT